jgi:tetratricopeptide (TPR) repeat protein
MNKSSPNHSELLILLEHYQKKNFKEAERIALIFSEQFPDHPFSWSILGAIFNQSGRLHESLAAFQKSVFIEPKKAEVHNNLSNTLYKLKDFKGAEVVSRKAIQINPKNAEYHFNLGRVLIKLSEYEDAIKSFKSAIDLKPKIAKFYFNLGLVFKERDRFKESEENFKKAIALSPDYYEAYNNLGIIFKALGKIDQAEENFNKALKIKPNFSLALLNRGLLLHQKGNFEKAIIDFDLCNTKRSRGRALSSLYALGNIKEIYTRIERRSKQDDDNLWIAAFSAFISKKTSKQTSHNFCNEPLDFIYFSNISKHTKKSIFFIETLIHELENINTLWEPSTKTTLKGFQSTINIFKSPLEQVSVLKSIIIDELNSYYLKFENKSCNYIKKWPINKKIIGWHVVLKQHGNQNVHIHPSGWLSGVIYLKTVPALNNHEGAIEFGLNGERYSDSNLPKITYHPKQGDIVLFPSSLHHKTIPFTSNEDRIVVAFDLMPKVESH